MTPREKKKINLGSIACLINPGLTYWQDITREGYYINMPKLSLELVFNSLTLPRPLDVPVRPRARLGLGTFV